MRSFLSTTILLLVCACLSGFAYWQWKHGDFVALLGAPPVPNGERLYPELDPSMIREIRIISAAQEAAFVKQPNGWHAVTPWNDRMAPEAAVAIIQFVMGLKAEDHADRDDVDVGKSGLDKTSIRIRFMDGSGKSLADFRIGHPAPWKVEVPDSSQPVATVFVQKLERHHKQHIYIGSGDIGPLFKDGFKFLRDHQPFYFHPGLLQTIRLRTEEGELTLAREKPDTPWRIIKPLDLPTDPASMKLLLEGLLSLRATRLSDRSEVSLTSTDSAAKTNQIGLTTFASPQETILDILPPESPEAREVKATVSDRPKIVFHLPSKAEPGIVTLANLPLSVNELRDPALTHLHVPSLRGISIQPATAPEILLTREGKQPWMATIAGVVQPANEENLFALLKAVTTTKALSFESDAVTDFTPYGLEQPLLKLRFLGSDNQALELRLGLDAQGVLFANRLGQPTVMRVDRALLDAIAIHIHEWRHSSLWSFDRIGLRGIERTAAGRTITLGYNFNQESWQARSGADDLTGDLNTGRANFLLATLEELRVAKWLPVGDEEAVSALVVPTLTFRILREKRDDDFKLLALEEDLLEFAPSMNPGFFVGRRLAEPHLFLITREVYDKLTLELLD